MPPKRVSATFWATSAWIPGTTVVIVVPVTEISIAAPVAR
jgi:hypothetical protein